MLRRPRPPCTSIASRANSWCAPSGGRISARWSAPRVTEVDWAGQTVKLTDPDTVEELDAYIFVAVLPYSGYSYAEAFPNMKLESWITAHVNAYNFFDGVTRILVPDNLKTGVIKNTKTEIVLNKTYQEMSEHYGTAVIPTRVRKPKDKATVEGAVGNISSFVLAAIRNQKFFSVFELNEEISKRLHTFNHKLFQKKDGSRATWFAEERQFLLPLPRDSYEMAEWKKATVGYNYHISVDFRYYSVPYEYVKREVDVRLTTTIVEVFADNTRICSHVRSYANKGRHITELAHMPPNHQQHLEWSGDRFRKWARSIGENTTVVVESVLSRYIVEQQGFKTCMAILKLADSYSRERLEAACAKALSFTPVPNYKNIQAILKSG